MRTRFLLILVLCVLGVLPSTAQPTLPLPIPAGSPTNQWAVKLASGTDADVLAASLGYTNSGQIGTLEGWYLFRADGVTTADTTRTFGLRGAPGVMEVQPQFTLQRTFRGIESHITDPSFIRQWHINNTAVGVVGEDANVFGAWNFSPLCCDGTGVVVSSVDDGLWWKNPDITPNYRADLSYDFSNYDANPEGGGHGTAVAGVMAAADDGSSCGVGVAYNAGISGIKVQNFNDASEASSLGYMTQDIHVYNNSWGPFDTGVVLEGPGPLTLAQMNDSAVNGRGGLGTIYVWANGNGLISSDDSNADGYTNLIYTISVAASTDSGEQSWYSEPGANLLVNAPSNGGARGITTTGYSSRSCTNSFGGTSSAAPLVAGVVALMLDANPNLTWRDVQYILMQTAEINDPTDTEWAVNAAGYLFNPKYGFGRVDATKAVKYAASWTGVPAVLTPISSGTLTTNLAIPDYAGGMPGLATTTTAIVGSMQLEQVEVTVNYSHTTRGDLEFILVSPSGTRSTLLRSRPDLNPQDGAWRMSSNQFWGETSVGTWTLEIRDHNTGEVGTLNTWELKLHGISQDPVIVGDTGDVVTLNGRTVTLEAMTVDMPGTTYQWYSVDDVTETLLSLQTNRTLSISAPNNLGMTYRLKVTTGATSVSRDFLVTGAFEKNLAVNTSMAANPDRSKEAAGWLRLNASGNDKVVCEGDACSFRFVSSTTEKTQLRQYLDLTNVDFNTDDFLTFSLNAKGTARGQLKLTVYYADDTQETCKKGLPASAVATGFNCTLQIDDKPVTEIAAMVFNKSRIQGQRLTVDDLRVGWSVGAGRVENNPAFALPAAPDGFRDNN